MLGLIFVVAIACSIIQKCRNCCRKYDCCHKFTDCGHRIFCEDNVVSAADLVEAEYHLRLRALASALKEDQVVESLQNRADMSETSSESGISHFRGDTSPPPYEDVVKTEMLPCRNAKDKSEDSSACDENDKDIESVHARDVEKERGVVNLAYEDKDIVVPSTQVAKEAWLVGVVMMKKRALTVWVVTRRRRWPVNAFMRRTWSLKMLMKNACPAKILMRMT